MYRAFINDSEVSPMTATLPAFFAKSSFAWPALLTLFGNKDIRNKLNCHNERLRKKNKRSFVRFILWLNLILRNYFDVF
jgi:hypothetical protein